MSKYENQSEFRLILFSFFLSACKLRPNPTALRKQITRRPQPIASQNELRDAHNRFAKRITLRPNPTALRKQITRRPQLIASQNELRDAHNQSLRKMNNASCTQIESLMNCHGITGHHSLRIVSIAFASKAGVRSYRSVLLTRSVSLWKSFPQGPIFMHGIESASISARGIE